MTGKQKRLAMTSTLTPPEAAEKLRAWKQTALARIRRG